jgi:transcriptional regulator EpsA
MTILDKLEQEYLLRTIESGVGLVERRQLFLWTQGAFQALLPHEIMLCVTLDATGTVEHVECLHRTVLDRAALARLKTDVAPALVARWQVARSMPTVIDANDIALRATGVEHVLVHGNAQQGAAGTVFALLGMPSRPDARQAYFLQLLLPYLHLGLLRMPVAASAGPGAGNAPARPLSGRELAVLDGVRAGCSNDEVARQLGISALTVKNHLQRSYRALGVANRAHAVARCLALRLL